LAHDASVRHDAAGERERQVLGRAAQLRPHAVGPVEIGRLEAAAPDVEPEVGVATPWVRSSRTTLIVSSGQRRGTPNGTVTSSPWMTTWFNAPW